MKISTLLLKHRYPLGATVATKRLPLFAATSLPRDPSLNLVTPQKTRFGEPDQRPLLILGAYLLLAGCALTPSSVINSTPAKPLVVAAPPNNGSIYQAGNFRPLFSDLRARNVGDVLTILLNENTKAGKQEANTSNKSGSFKGAVSASGGYPFIPFIGNSEAKGAATTDSKLNETGQETASNNFNGSISVQVIEVQPNGNMVVSGEKQVALDRGVEYIRFSGVVFPFHISQANTVSSDKVADVRVEYRSSSRLDAAAIMSSFSRFFQTIALPF
jgi:flagellar L-ring protein FlgH